MSYDNETYLQSLASQRADVDRQVANTRNEVNRQRDAALSQTYKIPGAINKITDAGKRQVASGVKGATSGINALGLGGIGLGGVLNNTTKESTGRLSDVRKAHYKAGGLMRQGFLEQGAQRMGQVDNISKGVYGDLDSKRNTYIAQREAEDRQRALQEEMQRRQIAQQQAAMAQQAALQARALAAARRESMLNRQHQTSQSQEQRLFEAIKNMPVEFDLNNTKQVRALHQKHGNGMNLRQFADYIGSTMNAYQLEGRRPTRSGHQI